MAARNTRYKGIKRIAERTFHVRVTTTDLRTGKRKEKKLTVQGRIEDALEVRERLRQEIHDEAIVPTAERRRVGEYAQSWMKRKAFELSPATAERYATALDRHILPALGDYYYDMVRRDDVQDWVNSKLMEGYKVGTVTGWFRVFGTMTRDAMAELEFLREAALSMGVGDHVDFTGRAPDDVLLDVLNTADVCVNPDEHNPMNDKSTMNKIMEYMALGKPIVQFDLGEGRVSAQEASLYAKPNDSRDLAERILELLDDPERRERMGAIGRQRVEDELAWTHEVPKLLAAYEALWS